MSGQLKNQNLTMLDDYEESLSNDPEDKEFKETTKECKKKTGN